MPQPHQRNYLYIAVFFSGMTTLAVEITASRLLGSVFGTSNLVWANVIGLILLFLAAGYFIGGRLSDRHPSAATFYRLLLWGAFFNALVPLAARPVLAIAARAVQGIEAALAVGSFVAVLVLFAAPITLLGMVSPFAIRLALQDSDANKVGGISGRIYAIGTLGSLIGTFIPVILIVPLLGTFGTFLLFAGLLFVIALIGLSLHIGARALRFIWMPVIVAMLATLALSQPVRAALPGQTILYEDESAYNYIQVAEDTQGYRYLYLNEGQGVHSQWHPTQIIYGRTWDYFLAAPYFNNPSYTAANVESVAIVGLAGGTIARQYTAVYPDVPIDGIEIDAAIIEAGARYFDMNAEQMPMLATYTGDARYVVKNLPRQYSLIAIDAYRPPYIPWQLCTVEFFQEVRDRLTDDGVVAINVGRTPEDRRLADALAATLLQVYPSVYAMDVPYSFNTILVATLQPTSIDNIITNAAQLPADANPLLLDTLALAASTRVAVTPSDLIFTDDRAPVETLVDSLVLNFLLSGGAETLR
ncbi:MAG: fused MFS/spermidine synthase [Chloroflexota bacterium]|nr:fused MFS/spermidine synthase [Chloroflexota bacterium]